MKKNIISSMLLLAGLSFFTACEDDRDSNPTVKQPTEFVLNTPVYANTTIDLEASTENINMSWSQPDYGFPIVATYYVQISTTGNFTHSVDEADADKTGATVADYVQLDGVTSCKTAITPVIFDRALNQLCKWEEGKVPATLDLHVRVRSCINSASQNGLYEINSNTINMSVSPYYMVLKDALPEMWYLIGDCVGDGKWTNDPKAIGVSVHPMSVIKDAEYDKKTGQGPITFTGYLTDGFKLVHTLASGWPDQWGQGSSFGNYVKNEGSSANISVPSAGYYTINLNTKEDKMEIKKADITPAVHESVCIAGTFNDWGDTPMTAVNTKVPNHIWTYTFETTEEAKLKFKTPGSDWKTNWGESGFPYGYGVSGGNDIIVPAGKYVIVFNDIDGSYSFTSLEQK